MICETVESVLGAGLAGVSDSGSTLLVVSFRAGVYARVAIEIPEILALRAPVFGFALLTILRAGLACTADGIDAAAVVAGGACCVAEGCQWI